MPASLRTSESAPPVAAPAVDTGRPTAPPPTRFPVRPRAAAAPTSPWRRLARDAWRGAALVAALHLFVVQISVVRGHSMEPSLNDGDRLVVDRLAYSLGEVERFDVVVLRYPADPSVDFVKRVVGLPGDRIRIVGGALVVNGVPVEESFGHIPDHARLSERVVPAGHYFLLGDNRPVSCDSREFGVVAEELIKGKVRACFWPPHRMSVF
jgi:signal peptidase I